MGLRVALTGTQSHAAMPWEGNNPMLPLADLAGLAATLPARCPPGAGEDPSLCTLVHLNVGTRDYGMNPGGGELGVTLRSCRSENVDTMAAELEAAAEAAAAAHGLSCEVTRIDRFGATVNDAASTKLAVAAAGRVSGVRSVELLDRPFSWSEDFGELTGHQGWGGGALLGIGGGEQLPVLHHRTYDFPDSLTPIGAELWLQIALGATGNTLAPSGNRGFG